MTGRSDLRDLADRRRGAPREQHGRWPRPGSSGPPTRGRSTRSAGPGPTPPTTQPTRRKEKVLKEAKSKAVVIDDTQYRIWDKWIADGKRPMIFATDLETGRHRNLLAKSKRFLPPTEPPPSANDYDISPDGKELCFVSDSAEEYGLDFNSDLYTLASRRRRRAEEHHR